MTRVILLLLAVVLPVGPAAAGPAPGARAPESRGSPSRQPAAAGASPDHGAVMVNGSTRKAAEHYAGRRLSDALRMLQGKGLKLVFSSELVTPDMRVKGEPRATTPREILDELLTPHGLAARSGPADTLLVVRATSSPHPPAPLPEAGNPGVAGAITGTVVDARTAAPIRGVLVERQGVAQHVVTDERGVFTLDDVPPGPQALYVSIVGYSLARPVVDVKPGERAAVTIPLAEGTGAYTEQVTVSAEAGGAGGIVAPVMQTLTSAGLQDLRGVLADDPFRAVQALPGVATGDDFRSEFSVRGSDFRHLGLSVDGVASRWLVHAVQGVEDTGSISMLNGDVLDRLSLLVGAYPQRFGDRTGAWLEAELREGSRDARSFRGAISGTNASVVAEGPVGRSRQGSWLFSVRQSYLDWLVRRVAPDAQSVFGFTDLQSKIVYDLSPHQHMEVAFVGGRSRLDEANDDPGPNAIDVGVSRTGLATLGWRSTLSPHWVVDQRLAVVAGRFDNHGPVDQPLAAGRFSEASYFAGVSWAPTSRVLVDFGVRALRDAESLTWHEYGFAPAPADVVERRRHWFSEATWRQSAQAGVRWTLGEDIRFHAGVLEMYHDVTRETTPAPWITGIWPVTGRLALRGGLGVFRQNPDLDQLFGRFGNRELGSERARHADLAFELRWRPDLFVSVAAYDRREADFLRNEGSEARLVGSVVVPPRPDARYKNALTGSARGIELTLRREARQGLSGWLAYALGRIRYEDALTGEAFWGDFDQRHTFNMYGQYRLSPRTSVSGKLRVGSSMPIAGYFEERDGELLVGTQKNTVRLPAYARLDVRANHTFTLSKRRLTLFVEVLNVLNRTNYGPAAGTVRTRTGQAVEFTEELLPLLPSAGLLIEF